MDPSGMFLHSVNPYTFPAKLWCLVNTPEISAIIWNRGGDGILIDKALIETQVLSPTTETLRKLSKFRGIKFLSFVRQLHHYGFRKVQPVYSSYPSIHHFYHPSFKKNHPELLQWVRRQVRQHRYQPAAESNACNQTHVHKSVQELHRVSAEILHQRPTQPFPVNMKQFSTRAQPLCLPGMPPAGGMAYSSGDDLGFDLLHHHYLNCGIPDVLQFSLPSSNQYNPGCYVSTVWWSQQMPVDQFLYDPVSFFEPTTPVFQPGEVPARTPSQRIHISSMCMPNTDNLITSTRPIEDSPQEVIEDPFNELKEMLLLVSSLKSEAKTKALVQPSNTDPV